MGNRFPGGALDDQAAALALVTNSQSVPWALRWAVLEIFYCGDSRHLRDYAKAFARIANEEGARPEIIRRIEIVAIAETSNNDQPSFAEGFRLTLNRELQTAFASLLTGHPSLEPSQPTEPQPSGETEDDEFDRTLFHPGVFGKRNAMRNAGEALKEAEKQLDLGNRLAAKNGAVKVLQIAQSGGWAIWGNLSSDANRAEEILIQDEKSATNVIRHYAPLVEAECNVQKWVPARHLIQKVGPLLSNTESNRLLDSVIEHVSIIVGDATKEIQDFGFLANATPELSPLTEFFGFIVWLCDHPHSLRRERAAAMLLWLTENETESFPLVVTTAFSMEEGYGPDVLCGILDGDSTRAPQKTWDRIVEIVDVAKLTQELRHTSRMVVLERIASRAAKAGSKSAEPSLTLIRASFTGRSRNFDNAKMPNWADQLARVWSPIGNLIDSDVEGDWEKQLELACSPLAIKDALMLEDAVSKSFREIPNRPFNRWESKLLHALNVAMWPQVALKDATVIEASLRCFNPSYPERTVKGEKNPHTEELFAAIESGDFSSVLTSNEKVLLNYHEMAVRPTEDGRDYLEVLCFIQPSSGECGFGSSRIQHSFCSAELPKSSGIIATLETCTRLEPAQVFFGAFTPAIQLSSFQGLVGAKDEDFQRKNWRFGRRNEHQGFGNPEREGCMLSVTRNAIKIPSGFKLSWIVWINDQVVTIIDEHNNKLM